MFHGIRHLREAVAHLSAYHESQPSREPLAKALREVWLSAANSLSWPASLREPVERLVARGFRDGSIDVTAKRMSEEEAAETVRLIRAVAAEAEHAGN